MHFFPETLRKAMQRLIFFDIKPNPYVSKKNLGILSSIINISLKFIVLCSRLYFSKWYLRMPRITIMSEVFKTLAKSFFVC